jgi:predicted lactoylglutathione lyase
MTKMIFVNLPVADLPRATAFYEALGRGKDERFCDAPPRAWSSPRRST